MWKETFLGIREFVYWSFEVYIHCGEYFLVERVKFLYKYCRFLGLEALGDLPQPPCNMLGNRNLIFKGKKITLQCLSFFRGHCLALVPPELRQFRKNRCGFSIVGFSNRAALFFSSGSRGLPPAGDRVRKEALKEHRMFLSRDNDLIALNRYIDVRELGFRYAIAFMMRYTNRDPLDYRDIHVPVSNSACLGRTLSQGGIRTEYVERLSASKKTAD